MQILFVEDDPLLAKATLRGLTQLGYQPELATNQQQAWTLLQHLPFEVILLDLGLPDGDGVQLIQRLRQQNNDIPILILTARDQIHDRVCALDAGADDVVIKPYDLFEVDARIKAIYRRRWGRIDERIVHEHLTINLSTRTVLHAQQPITLTSREFDLLQYLLDRRGMVLSRMQLQDALTQEADELNSNSIEVHIHHLRRKLGRSLIRTVHGVGYTIDRPNPSALNE